MDLCRDVSHPERIVYGIPYTILLYHMITVLSRGFPKSRRNIFCGNFEFSLDKREKIWYNNWENEKQSLSYVGGIAQLARAIGSYPIGRGFKSNFRYQLYGFRMETEDSVQYFRPVGQAVKTPPFHGGISSSILLRVTIEVESPRMVCGGFFRLSPKLFAECRPRCEEFLNCLHLDAHFPLTKTRKACILL